MNWIRYEKQKPNDGQLCVVVWDSLRSRFAWCDIAHFYRDENDNPYFQNVDGTFYWAATQPNRDLHWVPLPELPHGWEL